MAAQNKKRQGGEPGGSTVFCSQSLKRFQTLRMFLSSTESQHEGHSGRTVKVMVGVCLCLITGFKVRFKVLQQRSASFLNVPQLKSIEKCPIHKKMQVNM